MFLPSTVLVALVTVVLGLAPLLSSVVPSFGPLEVGLLVEGLFEALENISKGSLCNLVITVRFEAVAYSSWFTLLNQHIAAQCSQCVIRAVPHIVSGRVFFFK